MSASKHLLEFLRDDNFAHPGEEEAIQIAMQPIKKNPQQAILEVGCGLGGVAHFLQQHGFGQVTGLDIDDDLIKQAKIIYEEIDFVHGDVIHAAKLLQPIFSVLCCFSSFFSFPAQQEALQALAAIAKQNAKLIIFDYAQFNDAEISSPFNWSKTAMHFQPIYLPEFKNQLPASGWRYESHIDLSQKFLHWYSVLLEKFALKKTEIIQNFPATLYDAMYAGFHDLWLKIKEQRIGGIVVYATRL